jgi:Ni,Fe-hydrogenase maturation factor
VTTLVFGIGNPIRGDDAAGWILAERLAAHQLPGVEVRTGPQLQIEFVEDWARHDRVVVLDAAISGEPVSLERVEAGRPYLKTDCVSVSDGRARPRVPASDPLGFPAPKRTQRLDLGASHALSPGQLLALTQILHGRAPETYVCAVRGEGFELGAGLTDAVEARLPEALRRLVALLADANFRETETGGRVSY